MDFNTLNLEVVSSSKEVKYGEHTLNVLQYLPQNEKGLLAQFVLESALDVGSGTFSPIRLETYFIIGLAKWYAGIEFDLEDLQDAGKLYDKLETNGFSQLLRDNIPQAEYDYMQHIITETALDMAKFNCSIAGLISSMNLNANNLNDTLTAIINNIKSDESLDIIKLIKNEI